MKGCAYLHLRIYTRCRISTSDILPFCINIACQILNRRSREYVGFKDLTAVVMKTSMFCDITPCSPLKVDRRFGETYRLQLWVRRISQTRNRLYFMLVFCLVWRILPPWRLRRCSPLKCLLILCTKLCPYIPEDRSLDEGNNSCTYSWKVAGSEGLFNVSKLMYPELCSAIQSHSVRVCTTLPRVRRLLRRQVMLT
jgi:hypothetical protein